MEQYERIKNSGKKKYESRAVWRGSGERRRQLPRTKKHLDLNEDDGGEMKGMHRIARHARKVYSTLF